MRYLFIIAIAIAPAYGKPFKARDVAVKPCMDTFDKVPRHLHKWCLKQSERMP